MRKYILALVFFSVISGCDKSVDPENNDGILAYQLSGCLNKSTNDCFSYIFRNSLDTEFCVSGNCCPDNNRFIFEHDIIADTIDLYVNDIEERLCRCFCNYKLRASFDNLPLDSYQFNVIYRDTSGPILLYSERVIRQ
jgi:hypothetical protein